MARWSREWVSGRVNVNMVYDSEIIRNDMEFMDIVITGSISLKELVLQCFEEMRIYNFLFYTFSVGSYLKVFLKNFENYQAIESTWSTWKQSVILVLIWNRSLQKFHSNHWKSKQGWTNPHINYSWCNLTKG